MNGARGIDDHPLRYAMANEFHARPFAALQAPCHVAILAIMAPEDAAGRDPDADRAHLIALLDRYGATHPAPGATHWHGRIGKLDLRWERHTEFSTYALFGEGLPKEPFSAPAFEAMPAGWLAAAPGVRVASALARIEPDPGPEGVEARVDDWFVAESRAVSRVLGGAATVASDFRIDAAGHVRFAVFADQGCGAQRLGRIVQRLFEIEIYRAMSMLGLARARALGPDLKRLDGTLGAVMEEMVGDLASPEATLRTLLQGSAEIEAAAARASFRFGATRAYERIVVQRIEVLREARVANHQTIGEFMARRYDPAMRTVDSVAERLRAMSGRAARASDLLRTRVDVARSAQSQELLESMDRRAALQLRLQRTVEGLSVVAISYYAVGLALYVLDPLLGAAGVGRAVAAAAATPVVVLAVWWMVRRIRRAVE
jgi:uncharacterized membrane-anchored protein